MIISMKKLFRFHMLLLLIPLICDAQEDSTNKAQLQQLCVRNKCFKQILSSNTSESKEDDVFLINFVQRNDTIFTYIGFTRRAFLPELCCCYGELYTENPLTGCLYYNKRNCYIFGKAYGLFLKKTNKMEQLPDNLLWMAHLSDIKSREDTLLPKLTLTIDGKEVRYIDGMYYCDGVEYSLHIDPFLMVYAYHGGKFVALEWSDRYPCSAIEYFDKKR